MRSVSFVEVYLLNFRYLFYRDYGGMKIYFLSVASLELVAQVSCVLLSMALLGVSETCISVNLPWRFDR